VDFFEHVLHLSVLTLTSDVPFFVDFDQICLNFVNKNVLLRHCVAHYHKVVEKVLELLPIQVRRQVLLLLLGFFLGFFPLVLSFLLPQLLQLLRSLSIFVTLRSTRFGCQILNDVFKISFAPLLLDV